MRFFLTAFLTLPIFAQPRVEGTVINALTGSPVKNARIELNMTPVLIGHNVRNFSTSSDAEGRFVFDTIDAVAYALRAERAGFVEFQYDGLLHPPTKNLVIKLVPQSLIAGRVTDDEGEPVPDATVEVLQRKFVDGKRTLHDVNSDNTKGDGGYAIGGLAPGRYYIRVSHRTEEVPGFAAGRKGEVREAFETTLFPSGVDVVAGAQARGVDIQMRRSRVFRVSGVVKGESDKVVRLMQPDGPPTEIEAEVEDGHFEFRDVLPGTYELRSGPRDQESVLRGFTTVTIRDEDVKGIVLTPSASPTVTARFIFEGDRNATSRCVLRMDKQISKSSMEGEFVIHPQPRVSEVEVHCYPYENYVKSISLNGQKVDGRHVDFSIGAALTLDIAISPHAAHLAGSVPPETIVQVCDRYDFCVIAKGMVPPEGLASGEYRAFAWAETMDDVITSPEFRSKFESQSVKVKLTEKSTENVVLKVISKEAMAIEAAKIP